MRELESFQRAFGRAVLEGSSDLAFVTVHRNTVMKGLIDALTANYPTVVQLVGEEWFKACALEYVRAHPARSPVLALFGESFPSFLTAFAPAAELPYLVDVARIDRMWIEAHTAPDAIRLTSASLARLLPHALAELRLTLHPSARFAWVRHSAATIWIHHRTARPTDVLTVTDSEEGILLTRPHGAVEHALLDRSAVDLIATLQSGASLGKAAEAVLQTNSKADVAGVLTRSLAAGAFIHSPEMQL